MRHVLLSFFVMLFIGGLVLTDANEIAKRFDRVENQLDSYNVEAENNLATLNEEKKWLTSQLITRTAEASVSSTNASCPTKPPSATESTTASATGKPDSEPSTSSPPAKPSPKRHGRRSTGGLVVKAP
jgi:hypothetical protein